MSKRTVFTHQRDRLLKLLDIAYSLREMGYPDEAVTVFRLAANEGQAGLKAGALGRVDRGKFTLMATATARAWQEAGVLAELQAFTVWLTSHAGDLDRSGSDRPPGASPPALAAANAASIGERYPPPHSLSFRRKPCPPQRKQRSRSKHPSKP